MQTIITKKVFEIEAFAESESVEGMFYKITCEDNEWHCTCPNHMKTHRDCKHIAEVKSSI